MIAVSGVSKSWPSGPALDGVSLTCTEGEVLVIVGPSGSGKSTLLRCLNGLETFDQGSVTIAGHRLDPGPNVSSVLEALRRDVGMVFQQFHLFPHLSVLDNVALAPRLVRRTPRAEAHDRGRVLLDRVGLAAFAAWWRSRVAG